MDIQTIRQLREAGYKKVSLVAASPIPEGYFSFGEVAQLKQDGPAASFLYKGDVGELFRRLSALGLADAFIEEPTLEEIFLHYYQ